MGSLLMVAPHIHSDISIFNEIILLIYTGTQKKTGDTKEVQTKRNSTKANYQWEKA